MHYLHDHCEQPIIHSDLKPSNVLLDKEMIAHVSDFRLAKILSNTTKFSQSQISTIGIKGTIRYTAPEYTMGTEPSIQGDLYSDGILMLEMFTGKRPTDELFKDSFNLRNFVRTALPERLVHIVDSYLLETETRRGEERNYSNDEGADQIRDMEEGNIRFENSNVKSTDLEKCLVSVLKIGFACMEDLPNERMNMEGVTRELEHIRNAYADTLGSR